MLDLSVRLLLPVDTPILLAADDTLCKRTGRKVHGAAWHRDAATKGRRKQVAWGNDWVVVGVLVSLPFLPHRRVCLPVAARLWRPAKGNSNATRKHPGHPTKPELARELVEAICTRYPNRQIHLVGDAAYAGRVWRRTPTNLTVTCRLRADAALYQLPGPRPPGSPGRPPVKGQPMPELIVLAGLVAVDWQPATITCYGRQRDTEVATWRCLWYGPLGSQPVQVVLVRPRGAPDGYDLALVSTDLDAAGAELVSRYSHRWQIEVAFEEARPPGRRRRPGPQPYPSSGGTHRAVRAGLREPGCGLVRHRRSADRDLAAHRACAPWYRAKQTISFADMLTALRHELLAAQFRASHWSRPSWRNSSTPS
jgi:hypothetical protein